MFPTTGITTYTRGRFPSHPLPLSLPVPVSFSIKVLLPFSLLLPLTGGHRISEVSSVSVVAGRGCIRDRVVDGGHSTLVPWAEDAAEGQVVPLLPQGQGTVGVVVILPQQDVSVVYVEMPWTVELRLAGTAGS